MSPYHGDGGGGNGGADRRSRDDAAQGGAHVHRQYEAFTHRLDVLGTEWVGRVSAVSCRRRSLRRAETHHEALVKGRIHGCDDAAVRLPFSLSLVSLASFVVFQRCEEAEWMNLGLEMIRHTTHIKPQGQ